MSKATMTLCLTHLLACAMHNLIVRTPNDTEVAFLAWMLLQNVGGRVPADAVYVPVVYTWIQEVTRLGILGEGVCRSRRDV